jgi:hypothetical protein
MNGMRSAGLVGTVLLVLAATPAGAQQAGDEDAAGSLPMRATASAGVSGRASLRVADGATTVTITLQGLEPESRHAAHIHGESCDGPILFPLQVMVADDNGQGTSLTVISNVPDGTWWLQVHRGETPPGPGISCGEVPPIS